MSRPYHYTNTRSSSNRITVADGFRIGFGIFLFQLLAFAVLVFVVVSMGGLGAVLTAAAAR